MISTFVFSRDAGLKARKKDFCFPDCFNIISVEWEPLKSISFLQTAVSWCESRNESFFLACSNQITFPVDFDCNKFLSLIEIAHQKDADVLICSAVGIDSPIFTGIPNLYWVNQVLGINCMIIFKNAYNHILSLPASWEEYFEFSSVLTHKMIRKMVISPNIINGNDDNFYVASRWGDCGPSIENIYNNKATYEKIKLETIKYDFEEYVVPVYIINLQERKDRLQYIVKEFNNRPEFDVNIVPACKHECGALGLWLSIRKIISMAKDKEEDVIIICEDDHHFTSAYSKEYLFQQIANGYVMGADYLNGSGADFRNALRISEHLYWIEIIRCTQFIIIYKDFYDKILSADFKENVLADVMLSALTVNKMLIYPFVSVQRDFGYSDVTRIFNLNDGRLTRMFENAQKRLGYIKQLTEESSY